MGEAYRGLTIRFAADGTKVMSVLNAMDAAAKDVGSELRLVNRALKFDAADGAAASEKMKLLAEKAALAGAKVQLMKREMADLAKVRFGGEEMAELSARTKDASTQAALAKDRYNKVTEALAKLHNEALAAWQASEKLGKFPNPFHGWKDMSVDEIQRFMTYMEKTGSITKAEADRMRGAVASLRPAFREAEADLKKFTSVAQYQSFGRKMQEEAAKVKQAAREMASVAKEMRATDFTAGLKDARAEIDRLGSEASKLRQAMRLDPSSVRVYAQHVETMRAKMQALDIEASRFRAEMSSLGKMPGVKEAASDMGKLTADVAKARAEVDRLSQPFAEAKAAAAAMRQAVNNLEIDLAQAGGKGTKAGSEIAANLDKAKSDLVALDAEVDRLAPSFERAEQHAQQLNKAMRFAEARAGLSAAEAEIRGISAQLDKVKSKALISSSAFTSMGMQLYSTLYPAVMMGGHYVVEAAKDIDSAYRDMRKTVQGTEEDFENLKQRAIEFGDTHFTSADTMLEIESYGGQLGIAVENLEAFGKVVSDLDIATNDLFQTEDIALWLGKMANIMHLNVEEYDNFADALVRLGNSEPALESDIAAITSRFAGMATIVGMAPDQILAIATAATATGQKAEAAGGSLQRTLGRIEGAVAGVSDEMRNLDDMTEEDVEEFEKASGALEEYARIARMSSDDFANLWKTNSAQAFQKFVEGLKSIKDEGGSVDKTLQDLGITSVRDRQLLEGLTQTTDVLADSFKMSKHAFDGVSDEWGDAGDAAREADNKSQGFSGTLQIMINNAQHLAAAVGESLTPVLHSLTDILRGAVDWFDQLNPAMQTVLTTLLLASAGLGPLMTGIGAYGNMMKSLKTSMVEATSAEQTMARVNASMLPVMQRLGDKYTESSAKVDKFSRAVRTNENRLKNIKTAYDSGRISQAQFAAYTAKVESSMKSANMQLSTAQKSMTNYSKATMAISGITGFLKGLGSMAAFSVAFMAIDRIAAGIAETVENAAKYREATDGMRAAAERLGNVNDELAGKVGKVSESVISSAKGWDYYKQQMEESAEKGAAFTKQLNEKLDGMEENALLADYWADELVRLQAEFDGTPEALSSLQAAVDGYNSATGSSITITDELTGALSASTDEINANTEAFKANLMVKAYGEVASDAAKNMAEATVQSQMYGKTIADTDQKMREYAKSQGDAAWAMNEYGEYVDANMQKWEAEKQAADTARKQADAQAESYKDVRDAALEEMGALQEDAKEKQKNAEETAKAARSAETYASSLAGGADELERIKSQTGYAESSADDFTAALHEAGISAELLGNVGADAFLTLYESANGNLAAVRDAMNILNLAKIDPKHFYVSDDGTIHIEKDQLSELEQQELADKGFKVNDDGTIEVMQDKLSVLNRYVANPQVQISANTWVLESALSMLRTINGFRATASVFLSKLGFAEGAVSRQAIKEIPRHADGGLNGIVRRATLTNIGWVGEAGNEYLHDFGSGTAVVPIQNSRYVRPLAQSIAKEMGGVGSNTVNNINVTLAYDASADSKQMARDLTRELHLRNLMGA